MEQEESWHLNLLDLDGTTEETSLIEGRELVHWKNTTRSGVLFEKKEMKDIRTLLAAMRPTFCPDTAPREMVEAFPIC